MRANLLLAAGLLAVIGVGGGMFLSSHQTQPMAVASPQPKPATPDTEPIEIPKLQDADVLPSRPVKTVELPYYVVKDTGTDLVLVQRTAPLKVAGTPSIWRQAHVALTALQGFPQSAEGLRNPLPSGTQVLGVQVDNNGIAAVNLSQQFQDNFNGGAREEQMTIYALVNTVGHVRGVRGVTFQVAGKRIEEFGGHLDLSEPLTPDDSLVERTR